MIQITEYESHYFISQKTNAGMMTSVSNKKATMFSTYVSRIIVVTDVDRSQPADDIHSCEGWNLL